MDLYRARRACTEAAHYLSMCRMRELDNEGNSTILTPGWPLGRAIDEVKEAADALGFDLVKREPVKAKEAA